MGRRADLLVETGWLAEHLHDPAVALAPRGSEGGRCLSVGDYVRGRRGPPGRRAPPQRAHVAYAPTSAGRCSPWTAPTWPARPGSIAGRRPTLAKGRVDEFCEFR